MTVGRSPTASTPSIGRDRAASRIAAVDSASSWNRIGNRPIHPRVLEHVAPIGREDQFDAEPLRRVAERPRLVPGGRGQEQHTRHQSKCSCSGFGSAQQYQGSLRNGTAAGRSRASGGGRDARDPRAACASVMIRRRRRVGPMPGSSRPVPTPPREARRPADRDAPSGSASVAASNDSRQAADLVGLEQPRPLGDRAAGSPAEWAPRDRRGPPPR